MVFFFFYEFNPVWKPSRDILSWVKRFRYALWLHWNLIFVKCSMKWHFVIHSCTFLLCNSTGDHTEGQQRPRMVYSPLLWDDVHLGNSMFPSIPTGGDWEQQPKNTRKHLGKLQDRNNEFPSSCRNNNKIIIIIMLISKPEMTMRSGTKWHY